MFASASVFLDFNLPNATTWFYFSFLLAVALFFKFSRLLSIRNWDVVTLFSLVPGLLLIQGSRSEPEPLQDTAAVRAARLIGLAAPIDGMTAVSSVGNVRATQPPRVAPNWVWIGYLWLLCGLGYFFLRCLFDLALEKRPALGPNLSPGGLGWLASALFICLMAVAFRQADPTSAKVQQPAAQGVQSAVEMVGRESASISIAREWFSLPAWMTRGFAVLCHLLVMLGLIMMGWRHFNDASAGVAAATFYLMLPYTGIYVSQVHHVWPMVLIVWALVCFRYPTLSGSLLGLAAGTAYFPALTLPIWLGFYWKRGAGRFLTFFLITALICLLAVGLILHVRGQLDSTIRDVLEQNAWQPWKVPTTEGFWTGMHWAYRIPVFIAYIAFVLTTAFWPAPKNLAHVMALSAAVCIGIQFWYADQGGVYVLWYLPLVLLLVFRPNLANARPYMISRERDWACRLGRFCRKGLRWVFALLTRTPSRAEPAAK